MYFICIVAFSLENEVFLEGEIRVWKPSIEMKCMNLGESVIALLFVQHSKRI